MHLLQDLDGLQVDFPGQFLVPPDFGRYKRNPSSARKGKESQSNDESLDFVDIDLCFHTPAKIPIIPELCKRKALHGVTRSADTEY